MRRISNPVAAGLAVALLAAPLAQAVAHDGDRSGKKRDPVARLVEHRAELGLTDDQVAKLTAAQERYGPEREALRQQIKEIVGERPERTRREDLSPEERQAEAKKRHDELLAKHPELGPIFDQLKANRKAMHEEIQSILTPEQREKMLQKHKERRDGSRRGSSGEKN